MQPFGVPVEQDIRRASDREAVDGLLSGNEASVRQVRTWVRKAASGYRSALAGDMEDLEQEILVALVEQLSRGEFRHDSRLETYVGRIVQYKCIDRLRAQARRRWVDLESLDLASEDRSALQRIEGQEASMLALRVAAGLSEMCRELWAMIHAGLDYQTMASKLDVRPGTLRVRVLRCRRSAIAERERLEALQEDLDS